MCMRVPVQAGAAGGCRAAGGTGRVLGRLFRSLCGGRESDQQSPPVTQSYRMQCLGDGLPLPRQHSPLPPTALRWTRAVFRPCLDVTCRAPALADSHAIGQTAGCGAYQERNLPIMSLNSPSGRTRRPMRLLAALATAAGCLVPLATAPAHAAADPVFAYVANAGSDSVSVVDTATNTVTATITLGTGPDAVAVSPDGSRLYTSNPNADSVSVIDTTTNTVTGTVGVGNGPKSVTVSPDGARAYTADAGGDSVSVIETEQ